MQITPTKATSKPLFDGADWTFDLVKDALLSGPALASGFLAGSFGGGGLGVIAVRAAGGERQCADGDAGCEPAART